jgi:hypothetical protein
LSERVYNQLRQSTAAAAAPLNPGVNTRGEELSLLEQCMREVHRLYGMLGVYRKVMSVAYMGSGVFDVEAVNSSVECVS